MAPARRLTDVDRVNHRLPRCTCLDQRDAGPHDRRRRWERQPVLVGIGVHAIRRPSRLGRRRSATAAVAVAPTTPLPILEVPPPRHPAPPARGRPARGSMRRVKHLVPLVLAMTLLVGCGMRRPIVAPAPASVSPRATASLAPTASATPGMTPTVASTAISERDCADSTKGFPTFVGASLGIVPAAPALGDRVTLRISGFPATTRLVVWFGPLDFEGRYLPVDITSDADGTASVTFILSSAALEGFIPARRSCAAFKVETMNGSYFHAYGTPYLFDVP